MTGPLPGVQDLAHLQKWMQAIITHPSGVPAAIESAEAGQHLGSSLQNIEQIVRPSRALSSVARLEVYGNAYYARLLECLRETFPAVAYACGGDVFDTFAFGYLQNYPSTTYTLGRLADHFVKYLEETRPSSQGEGFDWPLFIIELTRLEWMFEVVFDGPGLEQETPLRAADLQDFDVDGWARATLVPAPCLHILSFEFPVNAYFTDWRHGRKPEVPMPRKTYLAVNRRDYVVRRYELSQTQHRLLSMLCQGSTVGAGVAQLAKGNDQDPGLADKLSQWFSDWAAAGFFPAVRRHTANDQ